MRLTHTILAAALVLLGAATAVGQAPAPLTGPRLFETSTGQRIRVVPVVTGLVHPWSVAFPDPRTMLVIGTDGVRATQSDCQVSSYRVPADGAAVVVIGWKTSIGVSFPPLSAMKLRRGTFDCFAGRGAFARVTRGDRDFQVNVLAGDRASNATIEDALDAARSIALASRA